MIGARGAAHAVLFVGGMVSLGCYKTVNVVSIEPLKTTYPVSASGQYVDEIGDIVTDEDYTIVKPFVVHRTVESPRHEVSVTAFKLKPDLDQVVAQWHGDAVVDLKVEAAGYDSGSHETSSLFKALGWTAGAVGGVVLVAGLASQNDKREATIEGGAVTLGVGVALYLLGAAFNAPTQWQLDVSGRVVKRATKAAPSTD